TPARPISGSGRDSLGVAMRLVRGLAVVVAVLITGLGLSVSPAYAHVQLASSDPANGATLDAAPTQITLTFTGPVNPQLVKIAVGRDGQPVKTEQPQVDGKTVTVSLAEGGPGNYSVGYRVLADDGHPINGEVTFTVTGGDSGDSATEGSGTGTGADESTTETESEQGVPAADEAAEDEGGSGS